MKFTHKQAEILYEAGYKQGTADMIEKIKLVKNPINQEILKIILKGEK